MKPLVLLGCDHGGFELKLKLKAGLATDHWSDEIQIHRYTTLTIA